MARIEKPGTELRKGCNIVIVTLSLRQSAGVSRFTGFLYEGVPVEFGSTKRLFTRLDNKQTEDYQTRRFGLSREILQGA